MGIGGRPQIDKNGGLTRKKVESYSIVFSLQDLTSDKKSLFKNSWALYSKSQEKDVKKSKKVKNR